MVLALSHFESPPQEHNQNTIHALPQVSQTVAWGIVLEYTYQSWTWTILNLLCSSVISLLKPKPRHFQVSAVPGQVFSRRLIFLCFSWMNLHKVKNIFTIFRNTWDHLRSPLKSPEVSIYFPCWITRTSACFIRLSLLLLFKQWSLPASEALCTTSVWCPKKSMPATQKKS